jgi:hypothetical protein
MFTDVVEQYSRSPAIDSYYNANSKQPTDLTLMIDGTFGDRAIVF